MYLVPFPLGPWREACTSRSGSSVETEVAPSCRVLMLLTWGVWKNWLSLPDSGIYHNKVLAVAPGGSAALWKAQACLCFFFLFRLPWKYQIFWTSPNTTWGQG